MPILVLGIHFSFFISIPLAFRCFKFFFTKFSEALVVFISCVRRRTLSQIEVALILPIGVWWWGLKSVSWRVCEEVEIAHKDVP